MSILIKGMEMPTGCRLCHFKEWTNSRAGWFCPLRHKFLSRRAIIRDKRYDDCPLVEIPPHGDLIDVDNLIEDIEELDNKLLIKWLKRFVYGSAVVIESEEEEYE